MARPAIQMMRRATMLKAYRWGTLKSVRGFLAVGEIMPDHVHLFLKAIHPTAGAVGFLAGVPGLFHGGVVPVLGLRAVWCLVVWRSRRPVLEGDRIPRRGVWRGRRLVPEGR
jgi:hypothetical protein